MEYLKTLFLLLNKAKFFYTFFVLSFLLFIRTEAAGIPYDVISSANQKPVILQSWQITRDISPGKPLPNIPNSSWIPLPKFMSLGKNYTGNWLIKTEILVKDSITSNLPYGLFPQNYFTAYEIYWDSTKIGQNGTIGTIAELEKPGKYMDNILLNPDNLTPGKHTLLLRLSNYYDGSSYKWYNGFTILGPYHVQINESYKKRYNSFLITGILFIPFLFNLFLYATRKFRTEHLLFSLVCLVVILDFLVGQVPVYLNVPTTFIHSAILFYSILIISNSILFPSFFIFQFSFYKKISLPVIFICNLCIYYVFTNIWNVFTIMPAVILAESTLITIWAAYKKLEGSYIILAGIFFAWMAYYFSLPYAEMVTIMVICTSLHIARQFAKTERKEKLAQLQSARLENELLKKNINPHFLMNTLTSIIAWLRKEPECAVDMIESLADEFRMITQISNLKLIPIMQEIELCSSHLKIMSYRKGADFKLLTSGIREEENVPPMIFHTLIENGLTHGYGTKTEGSFALKRTESKDIIEYIVSNDGEFNNSDKKNPNGMGLQYVEARLEESFPGKWELTSRRQDNSWEVIIKIKK